MTSVPAARTTAPALQLSGWLLDAEGSNHFEPDDVAITDAGRSPQRGDLVVICGSGRGPIMARVLDAIGDDLALATEHSKILARRADVEVVTGVQWSMFPPRRLPIRSLAEFPDA